MAPYEASDDTVRAAVRLRTMCRTVPYGGSYGAVRRLVGAYCDDLDLYPFLSKPHFQVWFHFHFGAIISFSTKFCGQVIDLIYSKVDRTNSSQLQFIPPSSIRR